MFIFPVWKVRPDADLWVTVAVVRFPQPDCAGMVSVVGDHAAMTHVRCQYQEDRRRRPPLGRFRQEWRPARRGANKSVGAVEPARRPVRH